MKNKQVSSCDIYLNDEFDQTEEGIFSENGNYMYGYKVNGKFNGFIANKFNINNLNFCYYSSDSLYMISKYIINNGLLKLRVNKYIDSDRIDSLHYIYNKSDLIKIINGDNLKYLFSNYKYDSVGNWTFREVKRYDSDTTITQYSSNRYINYYSDN
ncbi:hypothetical protein [Flammeovirga agarivorans]|uniref:Uncharacterized protein n=1 Tax=Flammeovirga agarivorans TaxID=2726742 RepID=A0A7X8SKN5_9BACT|nr:hypothetical protein [Flammeovirga agarivorans]NLR92006.1 hypothetical protein [Flammeovirga agarivorans]